MEFTIGSVVVLSSMLLLAILSRISTTNPDAAILRGEILPAMLSVVIATGLTVGLLLMLFAGESYFASRTVELMVTVLFMVGSVWIVARFARGARPGLIRPSDGSGRHLLSGPLGKEKPGATSTGFDLVL